MAKLYWATSEDAEAWHGPCETDEECLEDARSSAESDAWGETFGFDGEAIWIAPVDEETNDDDRFWDAVAHNVLCGVESTVDDLAEEGWIDPEEGWSPPQVDRDRILANALREILGPRPEWRTVDTEKARRVTL